MFGGYFGGGNDPNKNQQATSQQNMYSGGSMNYNNQQAQLAAAEQEMDMISDLFNRLSETCYKKCITVKYPDGELTKGESVCIDRCVAKYFQINKEVGEVLTSLSEANKQ